MRLILSVLSVVLGTALGAAQAADRGGVLRVGLDLEPGSLDPYFYKSFDDRNFYNLFYDNLVRQEQDGTIAPMLATSWTMGDDGKSLTLKLRDDVTFHDGTPFNAAAVKFNLDRLLDKANGAPARNYIADLDSVEVVDPYTVRLNLKRSSDVVLPALAIEPGEMASPTAVKKYGKDYGRHPVGTGPFVFERWSDGEIVAKRADDYWQKGDDGKPLPYLDGVDIRIVPLDSTRILQLRADNLDLINRLQVKDYDQIRSDDRLMLIKRNQSVLQYLTFNTTRPPFDNFELRKALALSIDRNAVEKLIASGEGTVATGILPPTDWAFSPDLEGHAYDLAAAKEAYSKSGNRAPLVLSVIQREPDVALSQLIQAMANAAGIPLRAEVLERQAWITKVLSKNYEVGLLRDSLPRPDPDMTLGTYYGSEASFNYSGVKDPEIVGRIDRARSADGQEARRKLYTDATQRLNDGYYQSFLAWAPISDAANRRVENLDREYNGTWYFTRASLKK